MDDQLLSDEWGWDPGGDEQSFLYEIIEELSERFFLSDYRSSLDSGEDYRLGFLAPEDWWPLANQLDGMVDLEALVELANLLDEQLRLPDLPTELLEFPLGFLESVLEGNLPREPSGRRVGSRRLVKIALLMTRLLQELPIPAQTAIRAWADVHRKMANRYDLPPFDGEDLSEFLSSADLPPAVTGFSLLLAMTLMRWPDRAEGMPLPADFLDPELYDEVYGQWESLPESPTVTEEGTGEAEALFAQGQLAHALAQLGTVEGLDPDQVEDGDVSLAYSRLSRAILWLHDQCRECPEREGVSCRAVTDSPEHPVPLIDVAGEISNTGRIQGCVRM